MKNIGNLFHQQTAMRFLEDGCFAYTSIHSTWQSNVRSYNHIKNFEQWKNDKSKLAELISF
jgi:hypothetical protein